MPNHVLQMDCTSNSTVLEADFTLAPYSGGYSEIWAEWDVAFNAAWITAVLGQTFFQAFNDLYGSGFFGSDTAEINLGPNSGVLKWVAYVGSAPYPPVPYFVPSPAITHLQFYHIKIHVIAGSPPTVEMSIDGITIGTIDTTGSTITDIGAWDLEALGIASAGALVYVDNFKMGTTDGGSDIINDDFEGGSISSSIWNSFISTDDSIIVDPGIAPPNILVGDLATIRSKTTPAFIESPDEAATPSSVTTLVGSYLVEHFTIATKDYDWNTWTSIYSFDGSIPVIGCVGMFDNDHGHIPGT